MFRRFLSRMFLCRHPRETRPITLHGRTYTCCLECGHERPFSWDDLEPRVKPPRRMAPASLRWVIPVYCDDAPTEKTLVQ